MLQNFLPENGIVRYSGKIIPKETADHYLKKLLDTIEWRNDETIIFGKRIITKREVAWYGDSEFSYTYSGITKEALKWTKELLELKKLIEEKTNSTYNSCLLNLYHNGNESMGWHSDDEKTLLHGAKIASLSFGAERKFSFKHKQNKETISLILEHGSLLTMEGETQTYWSHSLPKSAKVVLPRVSLTFRTMR